MPAVLFDAVGTLLRPEPGVAEVYAVIGERYGSRITADTIARRFAAAMARQDEIDLRRGDVTSQLRERERWQAIVRKVLDDLGDTSAAFESLWQHFADAQHWRLDRDIEAIWNTLARSGVVVGVASNFDQRLASVCRQWNLLADCPHVFVSSSVGYRKPSPRFFRAIERALGLTPPELLLVGDDWDNDYRAARAAGWHAVLVDPTGQRDVDHRISTLAELPPLVERLLGVAR